MLGKRIITIISVSLIAVSALTVLNSVRDNGDVVVTPGHLSSISQGLEAHHTRMRSSHARAETGPEKKLSDLRAPSSSGERRAVARHAKTNPLILFNRGRLSVNVHDLPLDRLLACISQRSGIVVYSELVRKESISIAFENLPLDEGLRRILRDHDAFFLYGAGAAAREPVALWAYPRGRGREMVPVPPERWASTKELEQVLMSNSSTGARMRAVEAVIERIGNQSSETVLYALNDANEQVRYSALSGVLNIGLKLPAGTLANLMQYDPSPFVRSLALKAMSEKPGADKLRVRSMAQAALTDPHHDVRAQARDVLVTLDQHATSQTLTRTVSDLREMLRKQPPEP